MLTNSYSYSYRIPGWIFGLLLLFFSLALFSIELGRVYAGSNNRGRNDSSNVFAYRIFPDNIIGLSGFLPNVKIENRWTWPWSTPTLLFSLVFLVSSVLNMIAAQRRNYAPILAVFISSILSLCLLVFLIAYYSTIIAGWKVIYGTSGSSAMTHFTRLDRNMAAACLAICCVMFLLFAGALIASGRSISACSRKFLPTNPNHQYRTIPYIEQIRL